MRHHPKNGCSRFGKSVSWIGLLAIASLGTIPVPSHGQTGIETGKPYPEFVLPRIDDRQPVSLSRFRGKKVLLIQFASW